MSSPKGMNRNIHFSKKELTEAGKKTRVVRKFSLIQLNFLSKANQINSCRKVGYGRCCSRGFSFPILLCLLPFQNTNPTSPLKPKLLENLLLPITLPYLRKGQT